MTIAATLVADGPKDRCLEHPLRWAVQHIAPNIACEFNYADMQHLLKVPSGLTQKITTALDLYPCDMLFIHRDAESQDADLRVNEIGCAIAAAESNSTCFPATVFVVPVRMTEAWLLFDASAIRAAASNPNSTQPLTLPQMTSMESEVDPKFTLIQLLKAASGLNQRRLRRFRADQRICRVAAHIADYSSLLHLASFWVVVQQIRCHVTL